MDASISKSRQRKGTREGVIFRHAARRLSPSSLSESVSNRGFRSSCLQRPPAPRDTAPTGGRPRKGLGGVQFLGFSRGHGFPHVESGAGVGGRDWRLFPGCGAKRKTQEDISVLRLQATNGFPFSVFCDGLAVSMSSLTSKKGLTEKESDSDHPAPLPSPPSVCPLVSCPPGLRQGHQRAEVAPGSRSP